MTTSQHLPKRGFLKTHGEPHTAVLSTYLSQNQYKQRATARAIWQLCVGCQWLLHCCSSLHPFVQTDNNSEWKSMDVHGWRQKITSLPVSLNSLPGYEQESQNFILAFLNDVCIVSFPLNYFFLFPHSRAVCILRYLYLPCWTKQTKLNRTPKDITLVLDQQSYK